MMRFKSSIATITGAVALTLGSHAVALPVIGGPTFNAATNTGYSGGFYTGLGGIGYKHWVSDLGFAVVGQQLRTTGVDRGTRAFVLRATDGTYTDLDPLGEYSPGLSYMGPSAINRSGQVAGYSDRVNSSGQSMGAVGTRWSATGGVPASLPALGSQLLPDGRRVTDAAAYDLNDSGTAVGVSQKWDSSGTIFQGLRPVVWQVGTDQVTELPAPAGGGSALHINNAGMILGRLSGPGQPTRYGRWSPNHELTELIPIYPTISTNEFGITDFNESGNAVGFNGPFGSQPYPMRWDYSNPSGQAIQLSTSTGYATAINDANVVVGTTTGLGMRWFPDGTSQLLGDSNWINDINNVGTVIGTTPLFGGSLWLPGSTTPLSIGALMTQPAVGAWNTHFIDPKGISDTGFLLAHAPFDPDGLGPLSAYERAFMMMIPQAGTYGMGDANFDEAVDFADLLLLAQNYGQANPTLALTVGDFDLSGTVDFADLLALAQNYGTGPSVVDGASAQFNADWKLAQSIVPEPGTLGLLAVTGGLLLRRRRLGRNSTVS